ncbi:MAG: hypothetical protein J6C58_07005, partial [Bacteroidaceae bacterium]|nr:hypothetical protein [Bacteroidaceae bacterium]
MKGVSEMATNVYEGFESIHEFFHAIETRPVNSAFRGRSCESHGNDKSFTMCSSWEEAVNLLNKGWDEPLNEIKKGVERNFKSNTVREKNRPQTGVVGYAPCVPNAIMGLPNSMIMTEKTPTKIKAVTINYSMSVTAGITTNQLLKAGISLLNIINNLELAG